MTEEQTRRGLAAGVGAFLIWGTMPLYIHVFVGIPAADVLAHRVLWAFVLLAFAVVVFRGWTRLRIAMAAPRLMLMLAASGALIAVNWLIYTWAVLNDRALDTSLGYFMQPLLNVAIGVLLLKEAFPLSKRIAVALAAIGVGIVTVVHGSLPWVSIGLALSFGFYGVIRKFTVVDPVTGLVVETGWLAPVAAGWLAMAPRDVFGHGTAIDIALIGSGLITIIPLGLFGYAARRLPLSTIGMLQYLGPSLVFLAAVFILGEPLDIGRLAAFVCIWAGLVVFSIGGLRGAANPARP
ncbi:EamA family transporter RarD [Sphingosinicella sp.]|uniref:EamA family transporter RarD n=1 Tax=Sphingosinicella sp. TaxID=1917971 RepID=UPI0025F402FA|nr:EamA family transporter RarD [Sphingosinicella sp.]